MIEILEDGTPAREIPELSVIAGEILEYTVTMYREKGFESPWLAYLAVVDGNCVGTCAFKSAPVDGQAEIAYFTFPGHEGQGVATAMVERLIEQRTAHDPSVVLVAQNLPESGASTRVLEKSGFMRTGELCHSSDGLVWEWIFEAPGKEGRVRELLAEDLAEIVEVRVATWHNESGAEELESMGITIDSVSAMLEAGSHRGWLCQVGDRIVGFAMGDRRSGEMLVVAVLEEFEGRGIGRRLLAEVESWLGSCGWSEVWLTTDMDESLRAVGFYRHLG